MDILHQSNNTFSPVKVADEWKNTKDKKLWLHLGIYCPAWQFYSECCNTAHVKNQDPAHWYLQIAEYRSQQICEVIYSLEDFTLMWESRAFLYQVGLWMTETMCATQQIIDKQQARAECMFSFKFLLHFRSTYCLGWPLCSNLECESEGLFSLESFLFYKLRQPRFSFFLKSMWVYVQFVEHCLLLLYEVQFIFAVWIALFFKLHIFPLFTGFSSTCHHLLQLFLSVRYMLKVSEHRIPGLLSEESCHVADNGAFCPHWCLPPQVGLAK